MKIKREWLLYGATVALLVSCVHDVYNWHKTRDALANLKQLVLNNI